MLSSAMQAKEVGHCAGCHPDRIQLLQKFIFCSVNCFPLLLVSQRIVLLQSGWQLQLNATGFVMLWANIGVLSLLMSYKLC
jgi:hypothetical protein